VTSGIVSVQRVLLLGSDDEPRRALHLMLDRSGHQVAAMAEVAAARRYLAANACDAVIAEPGAAAELAAEPGRPPIVACATPSNSRAVSPAFPCCSREIYPSVIRNRGLTPSITPSVFKGMAAARIYFVLN
jgi:hypothetical protein